MRCAAVLSIAVGTLIACSGSDAQRCPEPAPVPAPAPPPPPSYPLPEQVHLGDGTSSHNYYVIADFLRANPGSAEQTAEIAKRQSEAEKSSGMNQLKPPSANVVESELSHLLDAIASTNGGVGAAVFDNHGLKVAAAGEQVDGMVLAAARRAAAVAIGDSDPPRIERVGGLTAFYRPVLDFDNDSKVLGVSVLVTRQAR